ncbi:hypothetical protein SSARUM2_001116 [Serratia sp. K-E0102]|uniref:hypothetical protein n=1 Tax=Serratia TaxID=613 RepID=UPI0006692C6E|nr:MULTISPECIES: hypothetical protein [Serratia]WGZ68775.1 hypothetical protein SSARUM2_001116 [Serratia sp. K-E0102]
MKERNYDAIGRCIVAKRTIEQLIDELSHLRHLAIRDSVFLLEDELSMHDSMVECAATLATETRRIYDEIYSQALEYNRWAPLAAAPLISITRHPLPHTDLVQKELVSMTNKVPGHAAPHA